MADKWRQLKEFVLREVTEHPDLDAEQITERLGYGYSVKVVVDVIGELIDEGILEGPPPQKPKGQGG